MRNVLIIVLFFLVAPCVVVAQIRPKEGGKLNYRIIGFTFPISQPGSKYKIEIAEGLHKSENSFKRNIFKTFSGDRNKIIGEVPKFGQDYTWRVVTTNKSTVTQSELHHFSTLIIPDVDTNLTRLRILHKAEKYKDAYIFLDATAVLYDMAGKPVWFLPNIDGSTTESTGQLSDLKLSPQGTITVIFGSRIFETNYNGDVLWRGPNNNAEDKKNKYHTQYHHEFTRLANGHYMTLGNQSLLCKLPSLSDSSFLIVSDDSKIKDDDTTYRKIKFGILIEYDKEGNVVWSWSFSKYFKESDLTRRKTADGLLKTDIHDNAFFFDEQNKTVYISFRTISRVIKVKYPEGNVLNTYGQIYTASVEDKGNSLFCDQHACRRSKKGYLYLYNNKDCDPGDLPSIVMMQEPQTNRDTLKEIWEYECTIKDDGILQTKPSFTGGGGNVTELPDHSIFAFMGRDYSKVFIVSMDKEIIWSGIAEKWDPYEKKWDILPSYRASIIINKKKVGRPGMA